MMESSFLPRSKLASNWTHNDIINLMKFLKNNKIIIAILLLVILIFVFGINQVFFLRKAHSTFENYYAFRGCAQLLKKAPDYGLCKTNTGQIIKIVKFQNKWYLDGDLPNCISNICF